MKKKIKIKKMKSLMTKLFILATFILTTSCTEAQVKEFLNSLNNEIAKGNNARRSDGNSGENYSRDYSYYRHDIPYFYDDEDPGDNIDVQNTYLTEYQTYLAIINNRNFNKYFIRKPSNWEEISGYSTAYNYMYVNENGEKYSTDKYLGFKPILNGRRYRLIYININGNEFVKRSVLN